AAAVIAEHRHFGRELCGDRLPEGAIHGERMDERDAAAAVLRPLQGIGQPRPVTGGHYGGGRRSRACCQVWRTFLHDELRTGRPEDGKTEGARGAAARILAHQTDRVKKPGPCMTSASTE